MEDTKNKLLKLINGILGGFQVTWSLFDRRRLTEIYQTNPYVYAIIQKIATYHDNVRYMAVRDKADGSIEEIEWGLTDLIESPNILQNGKEFRDNLCRGYFTFGEAFIYGNRYVGGNNSGQLDGDGMMLAPQELVTMKTKSGNIPVMYYIGNNLPGIPPENMLHIKNYNPDWKDAHGLPFIKAAKVLIDKIEAADELEVKNFQNGGPAWVASAKEPNSFEEDQYNSFLDRFKALWKSPKNKGGIVGTSASIDLQHVGKSPVDLGSIESTKEAVKTLCTVFGLDAGTFDTDSSTYNNKQTIEKAIYTGVIIPFAEKVADKLTHWLGEAYGDVRVEIDTTGIEALQKNKQEMVDWMVTANVFTGNEIREAVSYDRIEDEQMDKTPQQSMIELAGFNDLEREVIET